MPRSLFLLLSLLLSTALAAQTAPSRIVSMNVCTDQLLLQLVEPERIASLSYLAADPRYSPYAEEAQRFVLNRGRAEEVVALAPDLVLTSQFSAGFTASLLERRGYQVQRFGFANTLDEVAAQVTQLGALTGRTTQAATLLQTLQSAVATSSARLRPLLEGQRAVFLSNNGFVYGRDTLQDSFLHSLGLVNVASEAGLYGPAPMTLEALLAAKPTLVFMPPASASDAQLAHPLLRHPVWQRLAGQVRRIALEDRWFDCAGPELLHAYTALERELAP
jgi:iron complex transport system substrate-binding protein